MEYRYCAKKQLLNIYIVGLRVNPELYRVGWYMAIVTSSCAAVTTAHLDVNKIIIGHGPHL